MKAGHVSFLVECKSFSLGNFISDGIFTLAVILGPLMSYPFICIVVRGKAIFKMDKTIIFEQKLIFW